MWLMSDRMMILRKWRRRHLKIGASKVYIKDLKKEFVTDYIFPALKANAVYENRYLLGTSLARPLIAKYQIQIAERGKGRISFPMEPPEKEMIRFVLNCPIMP